MKWLKYLFADRFMRASLLGFIIFEAIYWSSPQWAQKIHLATWEGTKVQQFEECLELVRTTCKPEVVHDGDQPIPWSGLPEWQLVRIERRFKSGLTVVSVLGPHENFQYLIRDLALPKGAVFRVFQGAIVRT